MQANRTIVDNLLAGGGCTIYAGQDRGAAVAYNIRIYGNWISRIVYPNGGYYGQVTAFDPAGRETSGPETPGPAARCAGLPGSSRIRDGAGGHAEPAGQRDPGAPALAAEVGPRGAAQG